MHKIDLKKQLKHLYDARTDAYGDFEFAQYAVSSSGSLAYLVESPDPHGSSLV